MYISENIQLFPVNICPSSLRRNQIKLETFLLLHVITYMYNTSNIRDKIFLLFLRFLYEIKYVKLS